MSKAGNDVGKTNSKVKYDPDFGTMMLPDIDAIYQVKVTESGTKKKPRQWVFFLFMPRIQHEEDTKAYLTVACESLLESHMSYEVSSVDLEQYDQDKLKYIPCASFDPDSPREFMWLTPPRYLWQ